MHLPDARAYCISCRFRREVCLCNDVRPAMSDIGLVVVIDERESRKMSNTGHLAKLVLPSCRVVTQPPTGPDRARLGVLDETHAPDGRPWRDLLFYPGMGAEVLTPEVAARFKAPLPDGTVPRLRLVIPDGTWRQARRIVNRIPQLTALPRVLLADDPGFAEREALRPRGNPDPSRVSTCEAIAAAFRQLGDRETAAALYDVYDHAALRVAMMRGKVPLAEYRHLLAAPAAMSNVSLFGQDRERAEF